MLHRLFALSSQRNVLRLHARCDNGEARVRARIDLYNDLSWTDDGGCMLPKEIMDNHCYGLVNAVLSLDNVRRVTSRRITGGEFITQDECESGLR